MTRLPTKNILVVEDELLVAEDIAHELRRRGGRTLGPVTSVEEALALLADALPDCVVLNALLGGDSTTAIASFLQQHHVPFVVVTGYKPEMLPRPLRSAPCIRKPYDVEALIAVVATMLGRRVA